MRAFICIYVSLTLIAPQIAWADKKNPKAAKRRQRILVAVVAPEQQRIPAAVVAPQQRILVAGSRIQVQKHRMPVEAERPIAQHGSAQFRQQQCSVPRTAAHTQHGLNAAQTERATRFKRTSADRETRS